MQNEPVSPRDEDDQRRWRRIYVSTLAFAALAILLLYFFSRYFAG